VSTGLVSSTLSQAPARIGDIIVVDATGDNDASKLEILIWYIFSSPASKREPSNRIGQMEVPFLVNVRSLAAVSPDLVTKITPCIFTEAGLTSDHLATCIVPKLSAVWNHPQWTSILQDRLIDLQEKLIEHCLNFLKKNNESEALVYWNSDRQFCNSLCFKIIGLLRELEVMYPLEGSQPINSRQTATEFRWEVECCIVLALVVEIENHLKNFMLVSTSKFIVDTLKAYVVHDSENQAPICQTARLTTNPITVTRKKLGRTSC
jgi:hypothetical protein